MNIDGICRLAVVLMCVDAFCWTPRSSAAPPLAESAAETPSNEKAPDVDGFSEDSAGLPRSLNELVDDWFWPDPFTHLGHVRESGKGWELVRVAGDQHSGREAGLSESQIQQFAQLYRLTQEKQSRADRSLRKTIWLQASEKVESQISASQRERIQQIVIQRRGYRAFLEPDTQAILNLSVDQIAAVRKAIQEHAARIARNREHTQPTPASSSREEAFRDGPDHRRERVALGWVSHQKVWKDIRNTLTQQQIEAFRTLRGPRAKSSPVRKHDLLKADSPGLTRNPSTGNGNALDQAASVTPVPELTKKQERRKRQLRKRLNRDLQLPENKSDDAVLTLVYGEQPPAPTSPAGLAMQMIPPAYRAFMGNSPAIHQLEFGSQQSPTLSRETLEWFDSDPDESLTAAISLLTDSSAPVARLAAEAAKLRIDQWSLEHWNRLMGEIQFRVSVRDEYPPGEPIRIWGFAAVPFGFLLLQADSELEFSGSLRAVVDGDNPTIRPMSDWRGNLPPIFLGGLSIGEHELQYEFQFQIAKKGRKIHGRIQSRPFPIEITHSASNQLTAASTVDLKKIVRTKVRPLPIERGRKRTYSSSDGSGGFTPKADLTIPYLQIDRLPVDLAMKVHVEFEHSSHRHPRPDLVLPKGMETRYEVEGMIGDPHLIKALQHEADSRGIVSATVIMTPSAELAFSHSVIQEYWNEPMEIPVQFRIWKTYPEP